MKNLIIVFFVLGMIACKPSEKELQQIAALDDFKTFVDSILVVNKTQLFYGDSMFIEVPIDPTDPIIVTIDTIVTYPKNGDSNYFHYHLGQSMLNQSYKTILKATQEKLADAREDKMKKFDALKMAIDTLIEE